MENYTPRGLRFFDSKSQKEMILVTEDEPRKSLHGWICYQHPDGQWVTLREATDDDRSRIESAKHNKENTGREMTAEEWYSQLYPGHPVKMEITRLRKYEEWAKMARKWLKELVPARSYLQVELGGDIDREREQLLNDWPGGE